MECKNCKEKLNIGFKKIPIIIGFFLTVVLGYLAIRIILQYIDSILGNILFWLLIITSGYILTRTIDYHDMNIPCCKKPIPKT